MKKILLLDDDKKLCSLLSSYLISLDFDVSYVHSVPAALYSIRISCPDLIISDIMMQDLDGYDLIKLLKLDEVLTYVPVIFLTAKGMTSDRIKGYNLGCYAYITKPFDPQELQAVINSVFENINLFRDAAPICKVYDNITTSNILLSKLRLTSREKSILALVIRGYMNKEIAINLNVGQRNVEKYVSRILDKTNTRNRVELINLLHDLN